jgi:hypothetical protein
MPTLDNMEIPKPKNWQDFERLVASYARINWPGCMVTLFGGVGQDQHGVDIYINMTIKSAQHVLRLARIYKCFEACPLTF